MTHEKRIISFSVLLATADLLRTHRVFSGIMAQGLKATHDANPGMAQTLLIQQP